MDFSDIVETPEQEPPEQAPEQQKKPYWQVLDEYRKAQEQEPDLRGMSLPDFSSQMNEIKGTKEYDEGLNDSTLRRLGVGIATSLHHFGGHIPGETLAPKTSLSEMFGGPPEGIDLPAMAGRGGEALGRAVGAPEWAVQAAKTGAEALPETAVTVGAAALAGLVPGGQPAVLPILGGLSGLSTYGETGRKLPAAISAVTAAALPKVMEESGQAILGKLGAKTVGELRPDLIATMSKATPEAEAGVKEIADQFSPVGLVQRGARLGAAQAGMLGVTKASEVAQIATEPDMSWHDKLAQMGSAFSPTSLVSSAIQQLPYTGMDIFAERSHPMTRLEQAVKAGFDDRFTRAYSSVREAVTGEKTAPTDTEVQEAWNTARGAKPVKPGAVSEVLESMGQLPVQFEKDTKPVKATDGEWASVVEPVNTTLQRANDKLIAQGFEPNLSLISHAPALHVAVRAAEFEGGTKEDIIQRASNAVVDSWLGDQKNLATYDAVTAPTEDPSLKQKDIDAKITAAITKESDTYDQNAAQRVAIATGNLSDRMEAGLVDETGKAPAPVLLGIQGGGTRSLVNSVVDDVMGRRSTADELNRLATEIDTRQKQIETERLQMGLPGFEVDSTESNPTVDRLNAEIEVLNKQYEEASNRAQGGGRLTTGTGEAVRTTIPAANATAAAVEAAYNYGQPGTKSAGKVLDVTDPRSVADFYKTVKGALQQAEQEWLRKGIYGPAQKARAEETFYQDSNTGEVIKPKTKPAAEALAEQLNQAADKPTNVNYRVANTTEADGLWRVVRMKYPEARSLDKPTKVGVVDKEVGDQTEAERLETAPDEDSTEGIDPTVAKVASADPVQMAIEPITEQMFTFGQLGDPAVGLGRKAALTQNVIDYVKSLSNGEIETILKTPTGATTVQMAHVLKQRYMRFMQFLRDGGDIHLVVTKEKEAPIKVHNTFTISEAEKALGNARIPSEQELAARKTLSENHKARLVISREEGSQLTFTPKGGEAQGLGAPTVTTYKVVTGGHKEGTITVRGVGDLDGLNRYLQIGDEGRPDRSKLGYKSSESLNRGKAAGLNFFEQFYWLSQKIRQERPDPRIFGQERWLETRPLANWQYVPPGFVDQYMSKLLVDWPTEMRAPLAANMAGFPTIHSIEKPGKFSAIDAAGKRRTYDVPFNPLMTLFEKGIKDQLLVPAHEVVNMMKRFGGGELLQGQEGVEYNKMMNMAETLIRQFPFIRNQMVGFGVTKDPYTRALFQTDKTTGSEGILLNPTVPDVAGIKMARLMRPTEVFPHLLEELAHSGVDFAYKTNIPFKTEVDRIFKAVQEHQKFMVNVTGGPDVSVYDNMHSMSRPEEMLAGMFRDGNLHKLLKGLKDDLGDLPWGAPATGSLWDRLIQMFRNLFEKIWTPEDAGTMLDRMAKTATRALDLQSMMNLENRRGIYSESKVMERLIPQRPTIVEGAVKRPVPAIPPGQESAYPYALGAPRPFTPEEAVRDSQSLLADAQSRLAYYQDQVARQQRVGVTTVEGQQMVTGERPVSTLEEHIRNTENFIARETAVVEELQRQAGEPGPKIVRPNRQNILEQIGVEGIDAFRARRAKEHATRMAVAGIEPEVLESRLGLLMPTIGNKARVLEDPDVKDVFRSFAGRARTVVDAFSGSGKVTEAMKDLGARTVLNVKDPRYFALFKEVKDNPDDFANRVAKAVAPIEAPREGKAPYMKDGSDLKVYLNNLQAQDPTVALLIQAQFMPRGREVVEGAQGAMRAQVTSFGLNRLPETIRRLSPKIDRLSSVDGWTAARNVRAGQGVVVDPPYVNSTNSYAVGGRRISPEERIKDYQRAVLPAAEKGAHFLIFDNADPKLMRFLKNNGFDVKEFTRPRATQPEFVATNGEVLESRVPSGKVFDVLNSAATHTAAEGDDVWFKPYDLDYFRNTFGPAFGNKMRLENRGGQFGYRMDQAELARLTDMDVNRMPAPRVRNWAPSAFETIKSLARAKGSSEATAEAIASYNMQFAAQLRNTEGVIWGVLPTADRGPEKYLAGMAWGYDKIAGITPEARSIGETISHEATHTAGFHQWWQHETPDAQAAYIQVTNEFKKLTPEERTVFLEGLSRLTEQEGFYKEAYQAAVNLPYEFAAEFMGQVGKTLDNVPYPSVYLRDVMRFAPDSIANLVKVTTLRRAQALQHLNFYLKDQAARRNMTASFAPVVENLTKTFNGLARSALEIAVDQAEFYRTRGLYPDMYKQLLNGLSDRLEAYGRGGAPGEEPTPSLKESEVLLSREGPVIDRIREFFHLPTPDGRLPIRQSFWDKTMTQFSQWALKYPIGRSFADMFNVSRGMTREAQQKLNTAMAGTYDVKNRLISDARTKDIATFESTPRLREAWSKVALMMNKLLDNRYDAELARVQGDQFAMDPQKVTGWTTPEWVNGALAKNGITDPNERRILQTVFEGTRNQITIVGSMIVRGQIHNFESLIAKAITSHSNMNPEASREVAQKLSQAVQMQTTDPQNAMRMLGEASVAVGDPKLFGMMFDIADKSWQDVLGVERFLALRMPAYSSERRPGKFGLYWEDNKGKITSRYFESSSDRNKYILNNDIKPTRVTDPSQDQNWGVSPALFEQMDNIHKRMMERFSGIFGEEETNQLGAALDMSTNLRDELNSRDVLKLTAHRTLAPGREELDMWDTHRHYLNAMTNALKNRFIKNEAALLFAAPEFDMQPGLKAQIQGHIKTMMAPDSPMGTHLQQMGFLYYLFANPSSMIMQLSHQVMGLAPMLTRMGQSVTGSYTTIAKANAMVMEARRRGGTFKDSEIDALVKRREREGGIQSWLSREIDHAGDLAIVNRIRTTEGQGMMKPFDLLKNRVYQGYRLLRQLYDVIPTYNSKVAFVAAVLHLRSNKNVTGAVTGERLYKDASFMQSNTMYPGGKENRPGFFQYLPRSAAQALWSLQTYANGLTTEMGELIRKSVSTGGMTPAQTKQVRKAAAQMLIAQTAVAGVLGLPFAEIMLTALEKIFPEHDVEGSVRDTLASLTGDDDALGNSISTSLMTGLPSAMSYAPDVGSRFALHGVFHVSPYHGVGWQELMGASGGILQNMFDAGQAGMRGEPIQGVQKLMPNGFRRIWKSLEQGNTYTTESGKMLVDDLRPEEIVARAIGFTPSRIARLREFEDLSRHAEAAEKLEQTNWTKKQVKLLRAGDDTAVQQNIAQRVADTKGVYPEEQLGRDIARQYEQQTMPEDLRKYGNRATVLSQKSLRGALGTQTETPGSVERLQLQADIAQRLGLRGPSTGQFKRAGNIDQLTSLYPNLTHAQATLLLSHAAGSRPSPDLYQELLAAGE